MYLAAADMTCPENKPNISRLIEKNSLNRL